MKETIKKYVESLTLEQIEKSHLTLQEQLKALTDAVTALQDSKTHTDALKKALAESQRQKATH